MDRLDNMRILKGKQNVISMSGYKYETQLLATRQVEAYWEGLRMGRLVPQRSEIDPRGIERALEYTFLLERISPGLARFRLAGMHLNDLLGMEVRGMPFTSFFTPTARQQVADTLEDVFDGPMVAELALAAERRMGKPAMDGRVILLPLRSDLGEVSRILGCLETIGPIGRAPRRFDVSDVAFKTLKAGHLPETVKDTILVSGFADKPVPFSLAKEKRPDEKHPALRLVVSNDSD